MPTGIRVASETSGDVSVQLALGRRQHDASPQRQRLGALGPARPALERLPLLLGEHYACLGEVGHVLDFDFGVRAYPPSALGGYWQLRWVEGEHRRETTAATRDQALAKAGNLVALSALTESHAFCSAKVAL